VVPAGRGAQLPSPLTLQAWQVGQVALPQQTPFVQAPLMHWTAWVQACPLGLSAQLLVAPEPWQVNGARQSASAVQAVLQAPVPQTYGVQLDAVGAAHAPLPLQLEIGVKVEPVQATVPHETVVPACWQAPRPLHDPVLPQGGVGAHNECGSGELIGTLAQLPALPATLHALQSGQLVVLQQTPSTQVLPVRQSFVLVQAWPRRFLLPQRLVTVSQMLPGRQSPSTAQAALQAVEPLQTYGAQAIEDAAWQVPRPSQVRPDVSVDCPVGQEGAAQDVLAS
jgi:hypothetical protein